MRVEIINKEEVEELFSQWSKFASVCYDSKVKNPEAIGKHCLKSGHTSGSRSQYINFLITDVPRFVVDQIVRHEVGVCKNVQSFRYVTKDSFLYAIPTEITHNLRLTEDYIKHMDETADLYDRIYQTVIQRGKSKERASEQARYVLPMATYSAVAIGFTLEAFINFCHKRLCSRTEDMTRTLARMMREEVLRIRSGLKDVLVPQCEYLMWCPESKGCGAYPSKEELQQQINNTEAME